MKPIKSLEELQSLATNSTVAAYIRLNGGLRSSKDITYNPETKKWWVYNDIDDTEQTLTTEQLAEETNIIEALTKNALYRYL